MDEDSLFILKHKGLVISFAYKNYKDFMVYAEEEKKMELIHEGYLGLLRARDLFNPDMGYQFSTYATRWIWGKMSRYFTNEKKREEKENRIKVFDKSITLERSGEEREFSDFVKVNCDEGIVDLINFLKTLSEEEYKICMLLNEGLSSECIADKVKLTGNQVRYKISKIREKIKEEYLKCS